MFKCYRSRLDPLEKSQHCSCWGQESGCLQDNRHWQESWQNYAGIAICEKVSFLTPYGPWMDILFLSYFPYLLFLISLIHYRQHSDGMKKLDQAVKDVDYYRQVCVCMWSVLFHNMEYGSMFSQEAENLRTRYNDVVMEKQRLDQEVVSLRRWTCKFNEWYI